MNTSAVPSPLELSTCKPMGPSMVALSALAPSPASLQLPVPANACITSPGNVMRRTRHAWSAISTLWSGNNARPRGCCNKANHAGLPLPVTPVPFMPASVTITRVSRNTRRTLALPLSAISSELPPGHSAIVYGSLSRACVPKPSSPLKPAPPAVLTHTDSVRLAGSEALMNSRRWSFEVTMNMPRPAGHQAQPRGRPMAVPFATASSGSAVVAAAMHVPVPA
jgi:hypothetical protein